MVQAPFSTQGLNGYSYVFNSPLNFVDPSGFETCITLPNGEVECVPDPTQTVPEVIIGSCEGNPNCHSNADQAEADAQARAQSEHSPSHDLPPSWANSDHHEWGQDDFYPGAAQSQAGADMARGALWNTAGAFQGSVPFGTLGQQLAPPTSAQDRINLGLGQLAGSAAVFGEAGGIAGGGIGAALTGVGVPVGVAAEIGAAVVAVGGAVNALSGIYNIVRGKAEGGEGNQRGVGGSGWRGDAQWKGNVKTLAQGGTFESLNGTIPTEAEATDLINEGGGRVVRVDPPHEPPNPHDFPHINYTTSNGLKGTVRIIPSETP
jgi:hypothetical protein